MQLAKTIRKTLLRKAFTNLITDDFKTWKGLTLMVAERHLAKAIAEAGTQPRVGIMLPTSGMTSAAVLACWRLGRVAVPINYLLSPDDIEFIIDDAELDVVITVGKMLELTGPMPDKVKTVLMEDVSFKGFPPRIKPAKMAEDDMAVLLYTSGTSGKPKGVILTAGNLDSNIKQLIEWVKFRPDDTLLGVLPQFHSMGMTVMTLTPLALGCKVVYSAKFMPKRILDLIRKHRPTTIVAVPSMYNALRLAKSAKPDDFSSLRFVVAGGEPLPDAVSQGFQEKFGVRIAEGYGLTETAPVANWCRPEEFKPHSVGRAVPRVEERIVSESGEILGPEMEGEIRIKGPNVMPGYFKRPEETKAAFDEDGFFRTGDMGRIDKDGHLFITGRIKEMLIIGGENVFPREIEEVLDKHPAVQASAVVGAPDESRGEVAMAFVELIDNMEFDETALRAFCRDALPQFKVPREIRLVEELPRNPTGKIIRRALSVEPVEA
jgi:long-chain acyl-CoA synthetase